MLFNSKVQCHENVVLQFFFLLIPPDPLINKKKNEKVFLCPGLSKSMRVAQYVVVLFPRKNSFTVTVILRNAWRALLNRNIYSKTAQCSLVEVDVNFKDFTLKYFQDDILYVVLNITPRCLGQRSA